MALYIGNQRVVPVLSVGGGGGSGGNFVINGLSSYNEWTLSDFTNAIVDHFEEVTTDYTTFPSSGGIEPSNLFCSYSNIAPFRKFIAPNLIAIPNSCFQGVGALKEVIVPKCETFGDDCFSGGMGSTLILELIDLSQVTRVSVIPSEWYWSSCCSNTIVKVPNSLLSAFQSNTNWAYSIAQGYVVLEGV